MLALLAVGLVALAWGSYAHSVVPLTSPRRSALILLRAVTLFLLAACLLRPVRVIPPERTSDEVVPVLVDVSRSMRLADASGRPRIDVARDAIARVRSALGDRFQTEVWTFGESLARAGDAPVAADAGRSDLAGALRSAVERYQDRRMPGVVVISDGGDTGAADAASTLDEGAAPVFTVGVGEPASGLDLEVADATAGEAAFADSVVDLTAAVISRGSSAPFDVRVLENGRPIDVRRVTPAAQGSPSRVVFAISPPAAVATLYTVEIPVAAGERVPENNRRSLLVEPAGRPRRVLMVEGAPGFEHTFVKRALAADQGLEIDSIVRKGRDAQGQATYFVQASSDSAPQLTSGFPIDREALFRYDALILANIENDELTRAQLEMVNAFASERGGGVLLLGEKSFAQRGLAGTVIEDVLPLSLADRGNGVVRGSSRSDTFKVSVTPEGLVHPVTRVGATDDENSRRWSSVPALAGAAALGAPRPGAQVLAVVQTPDGARPLIAIERIGRGRSMIFSGEASWRWRMQMPATDRTFELFWRQATRWLAAGAADPVAISPLPSVAAGDSAAVAIEIRDAQFKPVAGARLDAQVIPPGGAAQPLKASLVDASTGRYNAAIRFDKPGVYRITAEATQGSAILGKAERWVLVGGADIEMADPRLNEDVLRRVSRATGGAYVPVSDVSRLSSLISAADVVPAAPRVEELWHRGWIFAIVVAMLAVEWTLRRQWGLR
jgi:uncharacterized membrane protein